MNKISALVGDSDTSVKLAKSQLALIGQHNGSGMSVADLMIALINLVGPPINSVARAHSGTKEGGHSPQLRAPKP